MDLIKSANGNSNMSEWLKDTIARTTQGLYKKEWKAVLRILERGYWERAWIVRELASAAKINELCGLRSVSWEALIVCQSTWHETGRSLPSYTLIAPMDSIRAGWQVKGILAKAVGYVGPLQLEANRIACKIQLNQGAWLISCAIIGDHKQRMNEI